MQIKTLVVLLCMLLATQAHAEASSAPAVPMNQDLAVIDYFGNGQQTGCGLRATGETGDHLWLNVLVTVFMKETGSSFGVIKIVARKVDTKDDIPLLHDGKIGYVDIGRIRDAWIKTATGKMPLIDKNGEASHSDAYMVTSEFASTVELLLAISRESFQVGIDRNGEYPDAVYQFDQRLAQDKADKLSVCMQNLRDEIEAMKLRETF